MPFDHGFTPREPTMADHERIDRLYIEEIGKLRAENARLEAKIDALIKALKAHGVGAWGE